MTPESFRPPTPAEGPIEVEVDPDLMDLVPLFLKNRGEELEELQKAIEAGDAATVEDIGHRLKGLSGYGFEYVGVAGKALEDMARAGDISGAKQWVDALSDYLSRVEPKEGPPAEV